jgi:hypothetical protein
MPTSSENNFATNLLRHALDAKCLRRHARAKVRRKS